MLTFPFNYDQKTNTKELLKDPVGNLGKRTIASVKVQVASGPG